jgi:imidazolonepropionase-like amidohydrolase
MAHPHSRRNFLQTTGAAFAGVAGLGELAHPLAAAQAAAAAQPVAGAAPDLIVVNAKVYTMDPRSPRAEAFAVSGGRFIAVGSTADVRNLAGRNTQVYDAKGMTVVPGFIDCHNHAGGETLLNEVLVGNPFEVEFVSIRAFAASSASCASARRKRRRASGWKGSSSTIRSSRTSAPSTCTTWTRCRKIIR